MNRLIKFRGKFQGIWWHATPEDDGWDQFWVLVDKKTVGQYIGLSDKNKREVYDGDLVQDTDDEYTDNNNPVIYRVMWWDEFMSWELRDVRYPDKGFECPSEIGYKEYAARYFKVIGDIYDNPGLREHVED